MILHLISAILLVLSDMVHATKYPEKDYPDGHIASAMLDSTARGGLFLGAKMRNQTCLLCNIEKPITAFDKQRQTYRKKCRACRCKIMYAKHRRRYLDRCQLYREAHKTQFKTYMKVWRKTTNGREAIARNQKNQRAKYPDKYLARTKLDNWVRLGHIAKKPCEVCGSTTKVHGHHTDYSKPLDVQWLCEVHHLQAHGKQPIN